MKTKIIVITATILTLTGCIDRLNDKLIERDPEMRVEMERICERNPNDEYCPNLQRVKDKENLQLEKTVNSISSTDSEYDQDR
jgi:hypothetical protein